MLERRARKEFCFSRLVPDREGIERERLPRHGWRSRRLPHIVHRLSRNSVSKNPTISPAAPTVQSPELQRCVEHPSVVTFPKVVQRRLAGSGMDGIAVAPTATRLSPFPC